MFVNFLINPVFVLYLGVFRDELPSGLYSKLNRYAVIPSVNLLRQIVSDTHLFDLIELSFDPVDLFLLFRQGIDSRSTFVLLSTTSAATLMLSV